MGGLAKYMPITAVTCWIGSLALIGTPFFSGFYSKDAIIEAVGASHRWGAGYAYWCVLCGVFVTALYTFRMLFMTFHGAERFRQAHAAHATRRGPTIDPAPRRMHEEHAGAAARDPVGGHRAADRARHPLGDHRRADRRAGAVRRLLRPVDLRAGARQRGWARSARARQSGCAWRSRASPARRSVWRWPASSPRGCSSCGGPPGRMTRRERAARRCIRCWSTSTISTGSTRTCSPRWRAGLGVGLWKGGDQALIDGVMVDGTAAGVAWVGGRVAARAVGISVLLCLLDDDRPGAAAWLVPRATSRPQKSQHDARSYCPILIWLPIAAGVLVLLLGDARIGAGRWLALVGLAR